MKVFGIDPGSARTGYGCVASDGSRHRSLAYGVIAAPAGAALPEKLHGIHRSLAALLARHRPDCVVIENIFHAKNVRSALILGHARGVAVLAAVEAGVPVVEYSPAEIKVAVTGYGRADKPQMQKMVQLLLGLDAAPSPHEITLAGRMNLPNSLTILRIVLVPLLVVVLLLNITSILVTLRRMV